jgi:DNA modification methylase
LYRGDAVDVLRQLPDRFVQTCITSPPYWGLRDYGTGTWTGGDPDCDHKHYVRPRAETPGGRGGSMPMSEHVFREACGKCGARRVDSQLGLEATPEEYVQAMVEVFREVRRVLRDDGTVWLNLGDSYAVRGQNRSDDYLERTGGNTGLNTRNARTHEYTEIPAGLKAKDLVGVPWMVAFALRADGWYLRRDIIWAKRNGMPEAVTDRPSTAHEYVFLLSKQPRYFYDGDAIREPHADDWHARASTQQQRGDTYHPFGERKPFENPPNPAGRNRRSVWWVATEPFPDAHFATFPRKLIRPMILAGSSARGQCAECGAPWRRVVETTYEPHGESARSGGDFAGERSQGDLEHGRYRPQEMKHGRASRVDTTTGWQPSCPHVDAGVVPQVVLDPFIGSGTTAVVAREEGRRCVGIDLKGDYLRMAGRRSQQLSLLEAWQ